jgi:protein SCO1/2
VEASLKTGSHIRQSNWLEKLITKKTFWAIACGFFFIYPLAKSVNRDLPAELPILSELPAYSFTDENGKAFGSNELKGKVYIANFVFTTCQTSCPKILNRVQMVQHRMRGVIDRAAIVTFTVDPQNDTPEVLYSKARELKANPVVWRFLTAPIADIKKLLVDGFKVPVGDKEIADSVMDVAHSNKLVLVDQDGKIRGYYSIEKDGINKLMIDSGLLINRKKKS